jgi:Lrp/AsnC family transcriptional regulator, leucine-responsive regulatory protein
VTEDNNKVLDDIGWKILIELQKDARVAFAELGRRVGLSTPAVVERVRKLEDESIILGYRTLVDASKIGLPILAFIRISVVGDFLNKIIMVAKDLPEVLECHRVTGSDSFILKVTGASIAHLESVIDQLTPYVATTTSIVLSSAVSAGIIEPFRNAKETKRSRDSSKGRVFSK